MTMNIISQSVPASGSAQIGSPLLSWWRQLPIWRGYRLVVLVDGIGWTLHGSWPSRKEHDRGFIAFGTDTSEQRYIHALSQLDHSFPVHEMVLPDAELIYAIEPWSSHFGSREELERYVQARLLDRHGDRVRGCSLTLRPMGDSVFICAWPNRSRELWVRAFDAVHQPLPMITPFFSALHDSVYTNLSKEGWLLSIAGTAITIAGWQQHAWRTIQSLSLPDPAEGAAPLALRVKQLAAMYQIDETEGVWLCADSTSWSGLLAKHGVKSRRPTPARVNSWILE